MNTSDFAAFFRDAAARLREMQIETRKDPLFGIQRNLPPHFDLLCVSLAQKVCILHDNGLLDCQSMPATRPETDDWWAWEAIWREFAKALPGPQPMSGDKIGLCRYYARVCEGLASQLQPSDTAPQSVADRPRKPRLSVSIDPPRVTLTIDGEHRTFDVSPNAAYYFQQLAEGKGQFVSVVDIPKLKRIDDKLPDELRAVIVVADGKGRRIDTDKMDID